MQAGAGVFSTFGAAANPQPRNPYPHRCLTPAVKYTNFPTYGAVGRPVSDPTTPNQEVVMQRFIAWAETHREHWLDCVRIYLGLGLFARGLLLITNTSPGYIVDFFDRAGQSWLGTGMLMHYVTVAHFVGGLLLTLGFLTRIAAAVQIPILFGAVFLVHRQDGLFAMGQSLEFSALVLFLLVIFTISGAGKLSLDHVTFGPRARTPHDSVPPAVPQM
jgi:putative oxidoreductase